MNKKNFSKTVSKFQERFQHFYTYYRYQQTWTRTQADKATETDDLMTSAVYNGRADELANVVSHIKTLVADFENLITTGVIKKEAK